ncbi:MAG: hypothetical protein A3H29_17565 [Acidobacteria bacterium RIFCSPLOWO2_02_FULL_67_21]|nr:MAG: hypothetical protein A3H29_17565 [Acidobacteria bacterium RIFCSPLOWO2_02_FULL_67_21]
MIRPAGRPLRRATALLLMVLVWETASRLGWVNPFYVPAPSAVASVLATLVAGGELWPHLQATLVAAFAGLAGGLLIGIALGFTAALVPLAAELLEPIMMLLNAIPRVILAPLFVIWLGIDLASKVALALILVVMAFALLLFAAAERLERRLLRWRQE